MLNSVFFMKAWYHVAIATSAPDENWMEGLSFSHLKEIRADCGWNALLNQFGKK